MALKMQKELEMKLHEEFYKNVYILTLRYPPSDAFAKVFKKDMFVKNNKVGSQQAIYYLLEILDKSILKQKIKTWPIYNPCSEFEFRKEILKYINEINTIYEDADIPTITKSQLISPGGFKFIKFMFKLSRFILYLHLQRNHSIYPNLTLPLKVSKKESVTKQNIYRMSNVANAINKTTYGLINNFEKIHEVVLKESKTLLLEISYMNDIIEEYRTKLEVLRQKALDIHEETIASEELLKKLRFLKLVKEKFEQCQLLCSYLKDPLKLKYDKQHNLLNTIQITDDTLDLIELLKNVIVVSDRKYLEVKPVTSDNLRMEVHRFTKLNNRLGDMLEDVKSIYKEALELSEKLQKDAELAVPLSDST